MDLKIVFVCFLAPLLRAYCQECRFVSICNDEGEISNIGGRGEKDDRGIPGDNGPLGPPGEKGKPGVHGPPGINGAIGVQGPLGEKGKQGVHGLPGIDGAAGIQGLPGMKGNQGVKGESGLTDGIAAFQQKIQNLITDFHHSLSFLEFKLNTANSKIDFSFLPNRPVNCFQSDEGGFQLLRSGERAYCHQHWRVIQRRFNGQVVFHNKNWNEYKNGFGSLSTEFWIGLDKMYHLTRNGGCRLRVELGAFDGSEAYAEYREFSIGSESDLFRLHISGYSGNAGDAMKYNNNNMAFTTIDRDNDRTSVNCAAHSGGGRGAWWYNNDCGHAKLNGRWKENLNTWDSFIWGNWKRAITLKSSMKMIRCD